jgi:hypothetical protein
MNQLIMSAYAHERLTDESGDSGGVVKRRGSVIKGKNATNLKNHFM